jgi:predicted 3-demethylubiquinone-9 3-methyltransferase (glyoxalase superfamily)
VTTVTLRGNKVHRTFYDSLLQNEQILGVDRFCFPQRARTAEVYEMNTKLQGENVAAFNTTNIIDHLK